MIMPPERETLLIRILAWMQPELFSHGPVQGRLTVKIAKRQV